MENLTVELVKHYRGESGVFDRERGGLFLLDEQMLEVKLMLILGSTFQKSIIGYRRGVQGVHKRTKLSENMRY
jgi:hypothetical protein